MFTVQKGRVSCLSDLDRGGSSYLSTTGLKPIWPFVPHAQNTTESIGPDTKELDPQLQALGPLRQYVSMEAMELLDDRADTVLTLAKGTATKVLADGKLLSILQILREAMPKGTEGWSVVGDDRVGALKEFAKRELTPTRLKQM